MSRVSIFLHINPDMVNDLEIERLTLMGINWSPNKLLLTGYVSEEDLELLKGIPFVVKVVNSITLKYPFSF
jgi:hypothetical protein